MRTKDAFGFLRDFASPRRGCGGSSVPPQIDAEEIEEGKSMAVLAYIPVLCFVPFIQGRESNRFAYEHGKQGVLLFLFEVVALLGALFWKAALFLAAVASVVGIVFVLQGKLWKVPFIGELSERLDSPPKSEEKT